MAEVILVDVLSLLTGNLTALTATFSGVIADNEGSSPVLAEVGLRGELRRVHATIAAD